MTSMTHHFKTYILHLSISFTVRNIKLQNLMILPSVEDQIKKKKTQPYEFLILVWLIA